MQAYLSLLKSRPILTKSLTSGALFACGDIIAKTQLHSLTPSLTPSLTHTPTHPPTPSLSLNTFDWQGLISFSAFGCLFYAPSNHYWFTWMESSVAVSKHYSVRPMLQALVRVTLHSLIYAPFSIICLFIWMGMTQKKSYNSIYSSILPHKIFPIWWTGGIFWIPTMLSIYRFVPLHLRVLATSSANVFWTTYLSYKKSVILEEDESLTVESNSNGNCDKTSNVL